MLLMISYPKPPAVFSQLLEGKQNTWFSDITSPLSWYHQYKSLLDSELFVFSTSDKHPKLLLLAFSFLFRGQKSAGQKAARPRCSRRNVLHLSTCLTAPSAVQITDFSYLLYCTLYTHTILQCQIKIVLPYPD